MNYDEPVAETETITVHEPVPTVIEKVTAVLSGGKKILQSETTGSLTGPAVQNIQSRSDILQSVKFTMKTTLKKKAPDIFLDSASQSTL